MRPLLVAGGRVVDPSQGLDGRFDLLLEDGKVARLEERIETPEGVETLDASGLVVAPGFIDIHVHLREPGHEYKETVESGTAAAAAGGFTAVACMANTDPVNDNRSVTELILSEARRCGTARVYPIGAVSKGLAGEELAELGEMARAGIVAVSDDGKPVQNAELMRRALLYAQHYGLPVVQHAEDLHLAAGGVMHEGEWSTRLGLPGLAGAAEDVMVARDLLLLAETGGRYHVAHLSTARCLELVRRAKESGLGVTCEVTPHHLLLTDEEVWKSQFSTDTKMKPPLRCERDRQALLAGLADGTVDAIASDHAPHHPDEKDVEFSLAPFGVLGLETTVSLGLDRLVRAGVIGLARLVELLATGPARAFALPGGSLKLGSPADLTLLDLERRVKVDAAAFRSKSRNTPFHGWELTGGPAGTILGGRRVALP
ncbi:MAG TPA: dihydroorotase [Thermoanaerobaculia bacterium]|nr:dihydroorotase [Thermoanaerobaculia bacterium]